MLLHIDGKFTMGKLKSCLLSQCFALNRPSLSVFMCSLRYEADLVCMGHSLCQAHCDRCLRYEADLVYMGHSLCQAHCDRCLRYEAELVYMDHALCQAHCDRCDQHNHQII